MPRETEPVVRAIVSALTHDERTNGVAYLRRYPLGAGEAFSARPHPVIARAECHLAFVDPTPARNWGHDCRYVTVDAATFVVASHAARFPPLEADWAHLWRPVYQASGVPDSLVFGSTD